MLAWAKRHAPEAILIPAVLGAGTATALSNVPEVVPFGQEIGIGAMGLGYSYVVAYTFNWLAVERPRAEAMRGYHRSAMPALIQLSLNPSVLVGAVQELVGREPGEPVGADKLRQLVSEIEWSALLPSTYTRLSERIRYALELHRENYESLVPVLNNFDPAVSVAVAALNASRLLPMLEYMQDPEEFRRRMTPEFMPRIFGSQLAHYHTAARALSVALRESRFTPMYRNRREGFSDRLDEILGREAPRAYGVKRDRSA